jgi:hypothetical protein
MVNDQGDDMANETKVHSHGSVERLEPVSVVVVSPSNQYYYQNSLKQCACFISQLYEYITGEQKYYDYKLVRNRIDFDNGEFSGILSGWKLLQFKTAQEARDYIFNKQGIVKTTILRDEEIKKIKDEKMKRLNEEANNRIIDVHTKMDTKMASKISYDSTIDERLAEFDILFSTI